MPAHELSYRSHAANPDAQRRFVPTGAIHLLFGALLLLVLPHVITIRQFDLIMIWLALRELRWNDIAQLVVIFGAVFYTAGGLLVVLFPMRWRGLLLASLGPVALVDFTGVATGVLCIAFDPPNSQWSGIGTFAGFILGVPSLLLFILAATAFVRVARAAQHAAPASPASFWDN